MAVGGLLVVRRVRGRFDKSGARCVAVVVMWDIHWRPKALEQQYLRSSKTAQFCNLRFCDQLTSSDEIAASGMCP